ncbi:MAG TPA: RNA polymerase sigma factor [Bacteroidales bacterium]|nr:RNA polymerase sigma factor [Bacteroidales bacterium]
MSEVKKGNLGEMAVIFEKYHVSLYNFFLHMGLQKDVGQDLTQNLFYRMIKYRSSYSDGKNVRTWMYQIARNLIRDYMNERKMSEGVITLTDNYISDPNDEDTGFTEDDYKTLEHAITSLPADQRELIILCRYQGLKYSEVASILNISVPAVKVNMFRTIKKLRKIYFNQI